MIAQVIRWSIANRLLVSMATVLLAAWGIVAVWQTPVDAIPDLSDIQVIVRTTYPGQAPQVVEDQVTYPLTTTLLAVPYAKTVRGYSLFGESFVYIIFDEGTDLYWARSRVLEYLSQVQGRLPATARSTLGPDATGVGWIFEYALVDRSGSHDIGELRALQDWFLKYELTALRDVAEVATVGGFTRQYQVVVDPYRLSAAGITLPTVIDALRSANAEAGGSVLELGEAEYMVRGRGYLSELEDFRSIPLAVGTGGTPLTLGDVATVQIAPESRRGIAELDGDGEVVGGVIVLRAGANARAAIRAVRDKLDALRASLPPSVELVTTYDRSALIDRAVANLSNKLIEEMLVVVVVCAAFLWHLRSALVVVVTLPVGVVAAFAVMHWQGINANIMSLGGIAIALGAMVDAAVVMIENAHKRFEAFRRDNGHDPAGAARIGVVRDAAIEVGPALFFSLLIITLSFVPVFTLQAQEGRLFAPLAYTKTYAMAAAAGLSVTLVPVLMVAAIRGHVAAETANPLNRAMLRLYRPAIDAVLARPYLTLLGAALLVASTAWPISRLGSEFMPPLEEGDLLYMPTALPGLAVGKAAELLQQTDRIIASFPEVAHVFGKMGRADTATDPAPLEMMEATIMLKPKAAWRPGMTLARLIEEMDAALHIPGMGNVWVQPIRNRIDMLATGIKSPVGIKIAGPDLHVIERIGIEVEAALQDLAGTASVFAERVSGGRYIEVSPKRTEAARYGMSVDDLQRIVAVAIGGENVAESVQGLQRFPINVRYPRELRDSLVDLTDLPIVTARGETISLGALADVAIVAGPPMIKSENARPNGWVYVDYRGGDLGGYVQRAQRRVAERIALPAGYSLTWSGQYEYLERAAARLRLVVPFTVAIIFALLVVTLGSAAEAALILVTLPCALVGAVWLMYLLGHQASVASAVGMISLAGLAAEFGVVMLIYLKQALAERASHGALRDSSDVAAAIRAGALLRVRPKAMTVAVVLAGLAPLFVGHGTGSELMQRIAAPMLGGMITAPLLSMLVLPAAYQLLQRRSLATVAHARAATRGD